MAKVLSDLGADVASILRAAGLPQDLFSKPDASVRLEEVDRLLTQCKKETGRDDIGFRVGELSSAAVIGIVGLVSVNCDTVREAWKTIAVGLKTSDTLGLVTFSASSGEAHVSYELVTRDIEGAEQIEDCAIATVVNMMRELRGSGWRPSAVKLPRAAPSDAKRFQRFFGCPVTFGAASASVTFPAAELDKPVLNPSPLHKGILAPVLEKAIAEAGADFVFEARATLRTMVANGATPTLESFCEVMQVGRDKLKRRLRASGVSFSSIVDEARLDVAQTLLRSGKPVGEVALTVGYAETSSFSRAFTKQVGSSPSRWRAGGRGVGTPI
jgi:AraC-like DNA-binding protein